MEIPANLPEVICDKCNKPVPPWNNTKIFDVAYEAGGAPSTELDLVLFYGRLFNNNEVVQGNPEQSIMNVLQSLKHYKGRHFHETDECDGSPSRRKTVEGVDQFNKPLVEELRVAAQRAYELMLSLQPGEHVSSEG